MRAVHSHILRFLTFPSFVPHVTSQALESIIESATVEEIKSLRVAACQYFGRETLLRVHTSVSIQHSFIKSLLTRSLDFRSPCFQVDFEPAMSLFGRDPRDQRD